MLAEAEPRYLYSSLFSASASLIKAIFISLLLLFSVVDGWLLVQPSDQSLCCCWWLLLIVVVGGCWLLLVDAVVSCS